jgi:hypothetical protein
MTGDKVYYNGIKLNILLNVQERGEGLKKSLKA